jgi:hypothetical protein
MSRLQVRPRGFFPDISFGREPSNSTGGTFTRVASGFPGAHPSEANKWVKNFDSTPIKGKDYYIPNLVYYYQTADDKDRLIPDWLNGGITMLRQQGRQWSESFDAVGYKVVNYTNKNDRNLFLDIWNKDGLAAVIFAGHGLSYYEDGVWSDYGYYPQNDAVGVMPEDVKPNYTLYFIGAMSCYSYEHKWRQLAGWTVEYSGLARFYSMPRVTIRPLD